MKLLILPSETQSDAVVIIPSGNEFNSTGGLTGKGMLPGLSALYTYRVVTGRGEPALGYLMSKELGYW